MDVTIMSSLIGFLTWLSCINGTEIKIGILLPVAENLIFHKIRIQPAVDIALETVNELGVNGQYANFSVVGIYRDSGPKCSPTFMRAAGLASQLYYENDVDVFVGPLCSFSTKAVADLAAFWNIPIVSGLSTSSDLDNKIQYETLTRTAFKFGALGSFITDIFEKFGWKRCSLVWDDFGTWRLASGAVRAKFADKEFYIHDVRIASFASEKKALDDAASHGRSKY